MPGQQSTRDGDAREAFDVVVVVGGGPAGSTAAVFAARYGLKTLVFDRGNSALQRCAYLENYPGFPGGIDVESFHDLLHAHVDTAGADVRAEMVTSVERAAENGRFVVETDDGTRVTTGDVVVAAWYDGSYLRGLDDPAMFDEHDHHGEVEERFDPDYPDDDGRTPVDGLYVASPAGDRSAQAVVAAGNGAHVARALIEDHRRRDGLSGEVAKEYDWIRQTAEFSGEWAERDRWREWFENELDDDHELDEERLAELRERYVDRAFDSRLTEDAAAQRAASGIDELVAGIGEDRVLDAIDDERIREYVETEVPEHE